MVIDKNKLQILLARAGINQSGLAERLGVSRQAVSLYFNRTYVQADTAKKLADVLGCDVEDFAGTSLFPKIDNVKIYSAMAKKGFTAVALARESGVSQTTVYKMLHTTFAARPRQLGMLAAALDVTPEDLLKEE